MNLTNLAELKTYLKLAGLKPNKNLGQHFLIDDKVLNEIVETADLNIIDNVLEIGPGLGVLTQELSKYAGNIVAVESDNNLAEILTHYCLKNLLVINDNFLDFDLAKMPKGYKVIANLPYNITSAIFRKILDNSNRPSQIVALIQKEVAERIVAKPGKMSVLALSVQYFAKPRIISIVKPESFWPRPKIDSAIIKIDVYNKPAFDTDTKKLFRLIKAGFGEKRKMLKNSLSGGLSKDTKFMVEILSKAKISLSSRPQELSLEDWRRLYGICETKKII
ncbi:MAG: 16S rRNA (adenine(1518)-N(6)/adenine(1519)-N(6))-dimethyltransferase RsmA [bacterium]|nr:16S rRNA (adenine(1518)-N(6)/adenine(1519)-N(6))-dimethyltransferase RsmA [bacterium]